MTDLVDGDGVVLAMQPASAPGFTPSSASGSSDGFKKRPTTGGPCYVYERNGHSKVPKCNIATIQPMSPWGHSDAGVETTTARPRGRVAWVRLLPFEQSSPGLVAVQPPVATEGRVEVGQGSTAAVVEVVLSV